MTWTGDVPCGAPEVLPVTARGNRRQVVGSVTSDWTYYVPWVVGKDGRQGSMSMIQESMKE